MPKTNYQYEKRQRELEKKRKAEEKAKRKEHRQNSDNGSSEHVGLNGFDPGLPPQVDGPLL